MTTTGPAVETIEPTQPSVAVEPQSTPDATSVADHAAKFSPQAIEAAKENGGNGTERLHVRGWGHKRW